MQFYLPVIGHYGKLAVSEPQQSNRLWALAFCKHVHPEGNTIDCWSRMKLWIDWNKAG